MSAIRWRPAALAALGALLLALTLLGLEAQRRDALDAFVALALAQSALYLLAVRLVWHGGFTRRAVAVILALAALMRLVILLAPPYLSTDIYRYVWDGRVEGAGINPYRYIPVDPHLTALRDAEIFPNINRNNYAPTIYPPAAEAIFLAVTRIGQSLIVMKAAMVAFEAVTVILLLGLLAGAGLPPERILVYAWHPLTLWEFAGSGHIDAALVMFVALALWARRRETPGLAGIALAGAALVKFFPAVILPALWRRGDWKLPACFAATIALAYLPFLGAGRAVLGFLPRYFAEERLESGTGFYLWNLAKAVLPVGRAGALPYLLLAAAILLWLAWRSVAPQAGRGREAGYLPHAALLAAAFMVLLSPHYPWYFAWTVTFLCLVPSPAMLYLSAASFLLYLVPGGPDLVPDGHRLLVESAMYGPCAALALFELWRRRRRPIEAEA